MSAKGADLPHAPVAKTFRPARATWLLLGIALLAIIPRLYFAATQFVEYDGYWHVFVAMQDNWQNFRNDYQANFHPPLFYLLLKAALWLGRTTWVYRAIPLATGVAAVFIIGRIAQKITLWRYSSAVGALAYGLLLPSVVISCSVRSYMLSVFFVLVSLYYFVDMLSDGVGASTKSRIWFAACAVLACYSHYFAFFYVAAAAVVTAVFWLISPRPERVRRLARDFVTFVPINGALAVLYYTHARSHVVASEHLRAYYLLPGDGQTWFEFLSHNARLEFNLFSPVQVEAASLFFIVFVFLVLGTGRVVFLIRNLKRPQNAGALGIVLTGVLILAGVAAGGVFGKYPFGGELRQQFLLFPFAVLGGVILFDRLADAARPKLAAAAMWAAIAAIAAASTVTLAQYPNLGPDLDAGQTVRFQRDFPALHAVYVDQFNLIIFFSHFDDWKWKFAGHCAAVPTLDIYSVSRGAENMLVFRDKARWNADIGGADLYTDLAKCMQSRAVESLVIFYLRQDARAARTGDERKLSGQIARQAAAVGICAKKLVLRGAAAHAELHIGKCTGPIEPLDACVRCDDTSWGIDYLGNWTRAEFGNASEGTLTYTAEAGAEARLSFSGTTVTYVYTKAFNRGMAAVVIDGKPQGIVDLYGPAVQWQASATFGGLKPGKHTIQIQVLGRKRSESTGSFVDVDAFVVE
jgi:hypothetical protein